MRRRLAVAAAALSLAAAALAQPEAPAGDAATPTVSVGDAASLTVLNQPDPPPVRARGRVGATARCELGVQLPDGLGDRPAAPLPPHGGVFHTEAEAALWRARIAQGPFVQDNDHAPGSPGDWDRIAAHTRDLLLKGAPGDGGTVVRDAAFFHLLTGRANVLEAVRGALLSSARDPARDFAAVLCIRTAGGPSLDAHYEAAGWLLRQAVAYDFVRRALPEADRREIESALRARAEVLAVHLAWGLQQVFPRRARGDYTTRLGDAALPDAAAGWSRRFDANGDCRIDPGAPAAALPVHAYLRSDGTRGPRLSALSQWFNNRKSTQAAAVGAVGMLLGDAALVVEAKRYVMEWLAFSVWPDGSQGEFARNGDYCIAGQGAVYAQSNVQAAVLLARALARQGDRSLAAFVTRDGLYGSGGAPKSIERAALALLRLRHGALDWYLDEPWKPRPEPRPATSLGAAQIRYRGEGPPVDDYHELGLLPGAAFWPALAPLVLRDPAVSALPFPGADGRPVDTGAGRWTDVFNALPAMLLLRP